MGTYAPRTYESAYLAGVLAGKMTKSNTLGFVASVKIPEVIRNINAYTLGARSVNPAIKTKVVFTGSWFDMNKERQAAESLIGQGADVLLQNTDSPAVLKTAEEKGLIQKNDPEALKAIVTEVLTENPTQVADYKSGKESMFMYFVGQCMKKSKGAGNPSLFQELLKKELGQ